MKKFMRAVISICLLLVVASLALLVWLRATDATAADLKTFKRGDIIFQTSRSGQSVAIMLASKSLFSHMGIIDFDETGDAVVLEATATTRATPLQDWVNRGAGRRIAVYRPANLSDNDAIAVVKSARQHFGKKYDLFFLDTETELYCSEFVFLAFKAAMNLEIGTFQKVQSLDIDNFAARKVIKSRWQRHPLCTDGKATDFEACYAIIKQQKLITPQSIADDKRLMQIYSNYGG